MFGPKSHLTSRNNHLFMEDVDCFLLARQFGTPLYVYSAATLRRHFKAFDSAFDGLAHLTCYSVKANSNISLLKLLKECGAGMDIVSGGELHRALAAGVPLEVVAMEMGHSTTEMCYSRYLASSTAVFRKAQRTMEDALLGA